MAPPSSPSKKLLAFVLDIDGCLSKEGLPIPGSARALNRIQASGTPFVFCTNGGGQLESTRAARLSSTFSSAFLPEQIILSHTPLRELVPRLCNSRILVVGEDCGPVARAYGFTRVQEVREYGAIHPALFPRRRSAAPEEAQEHGNGEADDEGGSTDPIRAVLFFEDPEDLGEALQLVLDVLLTGGNPDGPRILADDPGAEQEVEVWFTNRDLVYAGLAKHPRLTQGSYRLCLEAILASSAGGRKLVATTVGKPSRQTGGTALSKLLQQCPPGTREEDLEVWTVGDNPRSDVTLANEMGWRSALVRTGIWDGTSEPEVKPTRMMGSFAELIDELLPET